MEILHFYFKLIPILLVFFILFLLVRKWKEMNQRLLPPGPWKLPLIGSLHHLIGALPHHVLRNLSKKYGPLMHLKLGEIDAVIVSSPHLAKQVLKVHDLSFAARPKLVASDIVFYRQNDIAFAEYGDYWKQMRKICTSELLSSKIVKSFSLIRQDEVHNLVASICSMPNVVVNMSEKVLQLTSSVICRSAFGKVWDDRDNLLMIMRELLALLAGFDVVDLFPSWKLLHKISGKRNRLMNMHYKLDVILENIINDHKQSKANGGKGNNEFEGENLIDVLLRVMENDELQFPMTNDNIKAVILDIFFRGTETSATTIQWTLSELMKNPNVMAKVQEEVRKTFDRKKVYDDNILKELKYLKLVIKETLRLHPPGPLLPPRECREETTIEGYTISLKTKLIVNCWAMGRDPESWDDPENFMPERFENSCVDFKGNHYQFIPFGAGSRMCPGMHFGLANVVYPLAQLLYHFDWQLPYGQQPEDLDMTETLGLSATRKHDLRLIAIPHDLSQY
ncbi:premnaspirodiene oxygenase-like [Solanum tuberosum]|uniref:premnaspirodiene oxygenase-like n=1 Tax=Solanum tuberosum TaxID=4113 RepID=UPI0003D280E6|nr:PREDICTED: premnaspirodiene oxygenase-like [Solanum tuberosum]